MIKRRNPITLTTESQRAVLEIPSGSCDSRSILDSHEEHIECPVMKKNANY